jgi:hypothetical protein
MKVGRTRELRVNLGNFEHIIVSATIEEEAIAEAVNTPEKFANLVESYDALLDKLLASDLQRAMDSSGLDEEASFVYAWTSSSNPQE